ncbi:hypothetical protein DFAR_1100016 [Desulfarculales bacterium]
MLQVKSVNSYDPRVTFDKPRPLTVQSANGRTQVVGQRFQGDKGDDLAGGGGLGQSMCQDFHPAVSWLLQGQTHDQGLLELSFKLPDSLTAYRLAAVATSQGKASVRANRPLQMLATLPRFAVSGDKFAAWVLVQNFSQRPGRVTVSLQATGLTLVGSAQQSLELSPGQSRAVDPLVQISKPGQASLAFRANLEGEANAAHFKLEVLPMIHLETAAMAGSPDPAGGWGQVKVPQGLPAGADPQRGGLRLVMAPSLATALRAPAGVLLNYPWDCLEQRLSKAATRAMILTHGPLCWGSSTDSVASGAIIPRDVGPPLHGMWATWGSRRHWIISDRLYCAFPIRKVQLPMERLSIRKIKEVLRLKHEVGGGNRDIAKSCGIGRTTVSHYLRRTARAGLSWPLPISVDET